MRSILIPVAALLISDALLLIGHGLLLTLLPVVAGSVGLSDTEVAFTGSAYFLGFVIGCLASPYMVRRVGHIRSFAVLAASYSAVALLFPVLPGLVGWLLLRFLSGMAISGLYMIIESWLNERSNQETRNTILSVYTTLNLLMIIAGQQLFSFGAGNTAHLFALAAIFLSIAIIPVSLTLSLVPAPLQNVRINLPKLWKESHTSFVGTIIYGLVTGAFWSLGPVYAKALGYEGFELTLFMSSAILGGAVFQLPVGRLSDHYDRRTVLSLLALLGGIMSVVVAMMPTMMPGLGIFYVALVSFFWGGLVMTHYSVLMAHANDRASPDDFVIIGSGMLLILGLCSAIGAPLASLAMSQLGPKGLYFYVAACLFIFTIITLIRRHEHELPPIDSSEPFRAIADMMGPSALDMDPRTEDEDD